jgi:hypothetical protein
VRENRRYHRMRPSGPTRTARIIIDPKKPAIDCAVVDISAGGACLEVRDPNTIPRRFELLHGGSRKKCSVVWKVRYRVGVTF